MTALPASSPSCIRLPDGLPDGYARPARVLLAVDADAASHGLAGASRRDRVSDPELAKHLRVIRGAAELLGGGGPEDVATVIAASSATATAHLSLALEAPANTWRFCHGIGGTNLTLLSELEEVAHQRELQHPRAADAVLLVAQSRSLAPVVRRLRLLGCPTWVLQPGAYMSAELYKASTAVTQLHLFGIGES